MNSALFAYPRQASFHRVLPKNKIYEHAKPSAVLRERFVSQIDQIVWSYKLAPETIHLPARPEVPEIQIFEIALKTPELDEEVLRCIDKAIPFPILYQLTVEDRIRVIAAYKRPNEADTSRWVLDGYFATPWQPADAERCDLPVALDLRGLYEQMLRRLIPLPPRDGETLKAQMERMAQLHGIQNECRKLEVRLLKEVQFNRKVELNTQLRRLKTEIDQLST